MPDRIPFDDLCRVRLPLCSPSIRAFPLTWPLNSYPILVFLLKKETGTAGGFNLGGTNASGQVPQLPGLRTDVIDVDTPIEARTRTSLDGKKMRLVFSDEFNQDGRSFVSGFWLLSLWRSECLQIDHPAHGSTPATTHFGRR